MWFDADLGVVRQPGQDPVSLTRSENRALALLSANPRRVVTRDQILDAVSGPGSDKSDRNVDFLINRLRRKLSDSARDPRYIATRYGEGYVWMAEVPLGLQDIACADAVIGPVRGLELIEDAGLAGRASRTVATALLGAFGPGNRVVLAPDCPPPEEFGARAPAHAAEVTFFSDRGRVGCIVAVKEFRARSVLFARRLGLECIVEGGVELDDLSRDIGVALWRTEVTAPSRQDPLPVSLLKASSPERMPAQEPQAAGHRRFLSSYADGEIRNLSHWNANDRRLRELLGRNPDDHEIKLLIALNTQSKYVTCGASLFASGLNSMEADEDEIEAFVTAALPFVRHDPEQTIIAGKLLLYLGRGYDDLARDLCEGAYAESLSIGRSLAIIGQLRAFFGETDAALDCIDQALNLAVPGSHAHLYAMVIKCQALAAAARWEALEAARRELSRVNRTAGFVLEPMFGNPEAPSVRARALACLLKREKARGMLMHTYHVGARLFRDPEAGANTLRSLTAVLVNRFGPEVVPAEVRSAFPHLLAARTG